MTCLSLVNGRAKIKGQAFLILTIHPSVQPASQKSTHPIVRMTPKQSCIQKAAVGEIQSVAQDKYGSPSSAVDSTQ